jgi:mannose-6-phosphate isomerase
MYLFEAIELAPEEVLGQAHMKVHGKGLGMLIKLLDAKGQFTLQCHPIPSWAKKMWNSDRGKEESWYVIGKREDSPEPPYVILGYKEGITRETWEKLYFANDMPALENLCHKIPVEVGDAFFVGGGCPHLLGKGCFVIEVQEPADITLCARPYYAIPESWKKPDEDADLYHARSLGAFIFEGHSYEQTLKKWKSHPKVLRQGDWGKEEIIVGPEQTDSFSFTELTVSGKTHMHRTGSPQVAIVTAGKGRLIWANGQMPIAQGQEIFFPANIPDFAVEGDCTMVLCNPGKVKL